MNKRAIDFNDLVAQVRARQIGPETLAILGGTCKEQDVLSFLQAWSLSGTPYRIWEYASEIVFQENTLPLDTGLLERGRLFGPVGDLSLRRDGGRFRWHFVGKAGTEVPKGPYEAQDFWQSEANKDARFHRNAESALLWGERKEGFNLWFEDRVAGARLKYPSKDTGRVRINYQTFSRAGRVEFVWLLGLEVSNG